MSDFSSLARSNSAAASDSTALVVAATSAVATHSDTTIIIQGPVMVSKEQYLQKLEAEKLRGRNYMSYSLEVCHKTAWLKSMYDNEETKSMARNKYLEVKREFESLPSWKRITSDDWRVDYSIESHLRFEEDEEYKEYVADDCLHETTSEFIGEHYKDGNAGSLESLKVDMREHLYFQNQNLNLLVGEVCPLRALTIQARRPQSSSVPTGMPMHPTATAYRQGGIDMHTLYQQQQQFQQQHPPAPPSIYVAPVATYSNNNAGATLNRVDHRAFHVFGWTMMRQEIAAPRISAALQASATYQGKVNHM